MKRIAGLAIPSFLGLTMEVAHQLPGEHAVLASAMIAFLGHVLAELTAGRAEHVLAGFERAGNHDLEFAFAVAYRQALQILRDENHAIDQKDRPAYIDRLLKVLNPVHTSEQASLLFIDGDPVDPTSNEVLWSGIRKLLLRWLKADSLPTHLETWLQARLPALLQQQLSHVLREESHKEGWIAWLQRYQQETLKVVRDTQQTVQKIDATTIRLEAYVRQLTGPRKIDPTQEDITAYLANLWTITRLIKIRNLKVNDATARAFDIDEMYTPLTTVLPNPAAKHDQALMHRSDPVELHVALRTSNRLLIAGEPGAGKTTFLHRIAFEACHVLLGKQQERAVQRMLPEPAKFPVLLRASDLAEHLARWHPTGIMATMAAPEKLIHCLGTFNPRLGADHFRRLMQQGCLLMIDALDEIPGDAERTEISEILLDVADSKNGFSKTQLVATSRPGHYRGIANITGLQSVKIDDLSDSAIDKFAEKWGLAVHPESPAAAADLTSRLLREVRAKKEIRKMSGNPVMLTALACLHFTRLQDDPKAKDVALPEQRSELYHSVLEWLAKARQHVTHLDYNKLLSRMRKLAFTMHSGQQDKRTSMARFEASRVLASEFRAEEDDEAGQMHAAEEFLKNEEINSGIIVHDGTHLRFWHQTFQEFLVAFKLAYEPQTCELLLFTQAKLHSSDWRETVLLLAGLLAKLDQEQVDLLLGKILAVAETEGTVLAAAKCSGLMAALLADLDGWQYTMGSDLAGRHSAILKKALSVFKLEGSDVPFDTRLEAAEALGQAGDPRLKEDNWITVPGRTFWMGAQKTDPDTRNYDPNANADEPVREVTVKSFQIGKYPVTVSEYRDYLDKTGSQAPEDWEKQKEHLNRPVTNVNWEEASNYCASIKGRYLPTEEEWECAARSGRDYVKYPWGDASADPTLANFDNGPRAPTPVGLYPAGATPVDGILDLAGNVWEWTSSPENVYKILRGGSWFSNSTYLRVAYRFRFQAEGRGGDIGFRCAREVLP